MSEILSFWMPHNAPYLIILRFKPLYVTIAGIYKNSAQRCTAIRRVLVDEKIADDFAKLLADKVSTIKNSKSVHVSYPAFFNDLNRLI